MSEPDEISDLEVIESETADAEPVRSHRQRHPYYATNPSNSRLFSPTRPLRIVADVRTNQALELRMQGFSYQQIADELGYSRQNSAYEAVKRALDALHEDTHEKAAMLRDMSILRLDKLLNVYFPMAMEGDPVAAAVVLRVEKARRDLLGLDAPTLLTDLEGEAMAIIKRTDIDMDEL